MVKLEIELIPHVSLNSDTKGDKCRMKTLNISVSLRSLNTVQTLPSDSSVFVMILIFIKPSSQDPVTPAGSQLTTHRSRGD